MTDNTSNTNKANTSSPNILTWDDLILHAYNKFYDRLIIYCRSKLKNSIIDKSIQEEDIVQQAYANFIKMVQNEKVNHEYDSWLFTYLKRSCENLIKNLIKKDKHRSNTDVSLVFNLSQWDRNDHISDQDLIKWIENQKTPEGEKQYEHLLLHAKWELYREIAKSKGLSEWTIKSKISKQRKALNQALKEIWEHQHLVLPWDESIRSRGKKHQKKIKKNK
jgi:RNA polymerase sigma factor (sigma-70 family)